MDTSAIGIARAISGTREKSLWGEFFSGSAKKSVSNAKKESTKKTYSSNTFLNRALDLSSQAITLDSQAKFYA